MKVLVACEYSGIVRDAFVAKGHDAWSCDILPTESPGNHFEGDVLEHLDKGWDLMIAHPPCTHLAVSGARWFTEGKKPWSLQEEALDFVRKLLDAPIDKIALENPVSVISTKIRKPNQIIQPYQFGHDVSKKTCLWLKNLPNLKPTKIVKPDIIEKDGYKMSRHHWETFKLPSKIRGKVRSRFYEGIAEAMADQWG
jgi:hypothetical protein|tara:strand:- start:80 stop:667 length:588 start_codon:yes stop_codon:yes gene_type:complete